jgi:CheY-like chemotaxis protein
VSADERTRILVVDDEEAILETMAFTFEDDYEVVTSSSPRDGLAKLEKHAPIAVVISDQRMPEMTGVEFLAEVYKRHPSTVRMILTGFADMDATIGAINDGHVYAYVTKPWEPDQLKQVVRRAVDHHRLACENERLLGELRGGNVFLQAVMDQLDTGALAVARRRCSAANRPAEYYRLRIRGPLGSLRAARGYCRGGGAPMGPASSFRSLLARGPAVRSGCGEPRGGALIGRVVLGRSPTSSRRRFEELVEGGAQGGLARSSRGGQASCAAAGEANGPRKSPPPWPAS